MDKAFNKVIKSHVTLAVLSVVAVVLMVSGVTYSLFQIDKHNTTNQTISVGTLDANITSVKGGIVVSDLYPKKASELGEDEKIYEFTISNTGTYDIQYEIYLKDATDALLASSAEYAGYTRIAAEHYQYINYKLDGNNVYNLTSNQSGEKFVVLSGLMKAGESEDHTLQFFLDNKDTTTTGAPNEIAGSVISLDIYFDGGVTQITPSQLTLSKLGVSAKDGNPDFAQIATTDEGVYGMEDDYGVSYYYRGAVTNNYVKFGKWSADTHDTVYGTNNYGYIKEFATLDACNTDSEFSNNCTLVSRAGKDMYWRIVRVNGDGTLRVIYDGIEPHSNTDTSTDRIIGISPWNESPYYNDAKYVGYMFGGANGEASTAKDTAQANDTPSTMKTYLENWYKKQIVDQSYDGYVSDNIFCNDRSTVSTPSSVGIAMGIPDTGLGYGANDTMFGYWNRFEVNEVLVVTSVNANLKCPNKNDAFTASDTTKGNGKMTYPVGLITADEFSIAGGVSTTANASFYLNKANMDYWTFSPAFFYGGYARVSAVYRGSLNYDLVYSDHVAVAPVINLSTEFVQNMTGDGSATSPFRLTA